MDLMEIRKIIIDKRIGELEDLICRYYYFIRCKEVELLPLYKERARLKDIAGDK